MRSEIVPGQTVLVAALPLPASGITLLADVAERLYGTGETMLDLSSHGAIRLNAPAEGFGPRVTLPLPEPEPASEGAVSELRSDGETLNVTFQEAQDVCVALAQAMSQWFTLAGGINYVTARFEAVGGSGDHDHWITVQKAGQPTAHDLRFTAELRVHALEQQLRDHGIDPAGS